MARVRERGREREGEGERGMGRERGEAGRDAGEGRGGAERSVIGAIIYLSSDDGSKPGSREKVKFFRKNCKKNEKKPSFKISDRKSL